MSIEAIKCTMYTLKNRLNAQITIDSHYPKKIEVLFKATHSAKLPVTIRFT